LNSFWAVARGLAEGDPGPSSIGHFFSASILGFDLWQEISWGRVCEVLASLPQTKNPVLQRLRLCSDSQNHQIPLHPPWTAYGLSYMIFHKIHVRKT